MIRGEELAWLDDVLIPYTIRLWHGVELFTEDYFVSELLIDKQVVVTILLKLFGLPIENVTGVGRVVKGLFVVEIGVEHGRLLGKVLRNELLVLGEGHVGALLLGLLLHQRVDVHEAGLHYPAHDALGRLIAEVTAYQNGQLCELVQQIVVNLSHEELLFFFLPPLSIRGG